MAGRKVTSRIDAFAGFSDRDLPTSLTRIESPDLRNVDFSGRGMERRNGYTRVHTSSGMLRDSSARFDGVNDFITIRDQTSFDFAAKGYVGIGVVLREFPTAEVTILSRGSGTSSSRVFQLSYDPGTSNGVWRLRMYDGSTLQNVTVADGDGNDSAVNSYRFIEVYYNGSNYSFNVLNSAGAAVATAATFALGGSPNWLASADGWRLASDTTSAGFANCTLCEFRLYNHASAKPSFQGAYNRELTDTEAESCVGYWKLNDGNGSTVTDSSGNNITGIIGGEGPEWVTDSSVVVGRSGLEFFGESGFIDVLADGGVASRSFNLWDTGTQALWTSGADGRRSWVFTFIYTPRLAPGETTVRDQTLFWSGAATDPSPLGVRVESEDLKIYYRDAASGTQSTSVSASNLLTANVNKRHRVVINCRRAGTAGEKVGISVAVEGATPAAGQSFSWGGAVYYSTPISTDGDPNTSPRAPTNPANTSNSFSFGIKISSFSHPITERADDRLFGVISDVAFFRNFANEHGGLQNHILHGDPFGQWSRTESVGPVPTNAPALVTYQLVWGLPLEDGYGNVLETTGETFEASLYPEEEDGIRWDLGLVDPYKAVEGQMLYGYDRIGPKGATIRSLLAISGTTLYKIDTSAGTATAVAGNLHKGGKWSVTQYGQKIFLACKNGKRPRQWNGTFVDWVGIRAPFQTPLVVAKNTSGSLATGTYHIKVTYRNPATGAESNPSPSGSSAVTTGSVGAIDSVQLPASTDAQVTQRRIWISGPSDDPGDFYLAATVEDNTTTAWTVDITAVTLTNTKLADDGSNEEPPAASIVKVFKDRLFVSGNPEKPTRVYWSRPGELNRYNQATDFVDADLDSGDPITALETLRDSLVAHMRDGRVAITASNETNDPFFLSFLSRDTGAIGPLAIQEFESSHVYVGERDIVLWDGASTFNASSPEDADRPSIQKFIRETINPARRSDISLALNRKRSQAWITLSTDSNARNGTILVFDYSQGVWSKYLMDMDVIAEIEDENDDPTMYGISWGHVCRLDTGDFDGHGLVFTVAAGAATGEHSTTTLQDTDHGGSWTVDFFKGMYCTWYDVSTSEQHRSLIASNDGNTLTFYDIQRDANGDAVSPANSDPFGIGAVEFWAEFNLNFGNAFRNVRLRWVEARGSSDSSSNIFRVAAEPDVVAATMPFTGATLANSEDTWATTETYKRLPVGGIGRNWRVRIGDTGLDARTTSAFPPSIYGRIKINELLISGVELRAP